VNSPHPALRATFSPPGGEKANTGGWLRGALLLGLLAFACHRSDNVATFKVEPSAFVRRVTADGNLKAKDSTLITPPPEATGPLKIAWIAVDGSLVKKDDVIVRFDPTDFETLLVGGKEAETSAGNKMRKSVVDADMTRDNLQKDAGQATDELQSARRFRFDDADVFSRFQRIESQVDESLALAKREHATSVLGVRVSLSKADRDLIDIEKKKADLKIRNAELGLHALEVRAPHEGILVLQRDWRGDVPRVGATIWNGSQVAEIPDMREMKAEVFVLEADAAGIAVGQKAAVTIDSQPGARYSGKVTQIDKLARPRVRGVPVQYFGVTVALDKCDPKVMKPGARVKATIEVENRANAFTIPRQALFEKEGRRIVYRRVNGKFVSSVVTIATSSAGRVVVTKGIMSGDELALTDPTAKREEKRS